jgi:hypothetical protein
MQETEKYRGYAADCRRLAAADSDGYVPLKMARLRLTQNRPRTSLKGGTCSKDRRYSSPSFNIVRATKAIGRSAQNRSFAAGSLSNAKGDARDSWERVSLSRIAPSGA